MVRNGHGHLGVPGNQIIIVAKKLVDNIGKVGMIFHALTNRQWSAKLQVKSFIMNS